MKSTQQALAVLTNTRKKAAKVVSKLVRSAIANAKNKGIDETGLYISKIYANDGVTWKRFQANAFGRGARILKRTSHITVELDKKEEKPENIKQIKTAKKRKVIKKAEKPVKAKKKISKKEKKTKKAKKQ
jgi:large subunit ribosomal protein L22